MKRLLVLFAVGFAVSMAQDNAPEIRGLRTYAFDDEYLPPIVLLGDRITIEFDVSAKLPPDLQIAFAHASKDWIADKNVFLNEDYHTKSQQLQFTVAPNGVHHYSYHYKNVFPDAMDIVRFPYSGNYLFTIYDKDSSGIILAQGRFIVVENAVGTTMRVENRYYTESVSPYNQMHFIEVAVSVPSADNQPIEGRINHPDVKTVDIIQNWRLMTPFRIDVDEKNPDAYVVESYTPNKRFVIRNVPPGNEYRRLDIGSARLYPNAEVVRLKEGADLSRFQWEGKIDANGASKLRPFIGANSDYLDVEFRLELPSPSEKDIFLVGAFNQWQLSPDYRMHLEPSGNMYSLHKWIRRGVYDYQYVEATFDFLSGQFRNENWLRLEGNDWRTINRYTAVVYCHDPRFGGFDRAVGTATAKSPGGMRETQTTN